MPKHTFEENLVNILNDCKTVRTLHFIKDKYNFSHDKLCFTLEKLVAEGLIKITIKSGDGRRIKQIATTELGREKLKELGVKF
jgi:DNA-binding PadR family transcriptional regulator